jgi:beta-galactosidase
MQLGVCYYPEHWNPNRWAVDAQQMRSIGLEIVRIAEFSWHKIESSVGDYQWEWLDTAIETLSAAGLKVVLGTPTATPPPWLCEAFPDILPVDANGHTRHYGSRRHYCPNSPAYRQHSQRIVQAMAERYGQDPRIIGWQIDNEFGDHDTARCYCQHCTRAFREWLKNRYGSLDALNEAWGAVFWSQSYTRWEQIRLPNLTVVNPNPSTVLDFYRFASDSVVSYQNLQLELLRQLAPSHFVTTNLLGSYHDLDYHKLAHGLDFVSWDSYPTGYTETHGHRLYPPGERPQFAYDVGDPFVIGFCHALTYGLLRRPFWIMEQQIGNVNWTDYNTGVRPGTPRLWAWHAAGHGADAVVFFRWRACLFAQEQYHSGVLNHAAEPALGWDEIQTLQAELAELNQFTSQPPTAKVALLLDYENLWAIQLQPHHKEFSYLRHLFVWYCALQALAIPVEIVSHRADFAQFQCIIAPTLHLNEEGLAERLQVFAAQGGQVVVGIRSGFKTESNRVTDAPLPGVYRTLLGSKVLAWSSLPPQVQCAVQGVFAMPDPACQWVESLQCETSQPLLNYTSGLYAGKAALTCQAHWAGNAYAFGWYPSVEQARTFLAWLAERHAIPRLVDALPFGVFATQRGGQMLLLNFLDLPQVVEVGGRRHSLAARGVLMV